MSTKKSTPRTPVRKQRDSSVTKKASAPSRRPGRPGGARDENRRARTEALRKAALGLFLVRGIEAVTIDEIAEGAGLAKGSFYRYFEDKTALVAALFAPVTQHVEQALTRCEARLTEVKDRSAAYAAYQELALGLLPIALFHFDVVRLYLQESRGPSEGARAPVAALVDLVERGAVRLSEVAVEHGIVAVADPRITAHATVGAIEQLTLAVLRGRLDAAPLEIVSTLIRTIMDGVGVRPEGAR